MEETLFKATGKPMASKYSYRFLNLLLVPSYFLNFITLNIFCLKFECNNIHLEIGSMKMYNTIKNGNKPSMHIEHYILVTKRQAETLLSAPARTSALTNSPGGGIWELLP
jgi:hypothetical protein